MKYGAGLDTKPTLAEYRVDTPKARYAIRASKMKHPEYHTQKHHLISVSLFKPLSKLKFNAKLVSYDVNHPHNGACYPTYMIDIARHDLQAHRGSHTNELYYDKVRPKLKAIETACLVYCTHDQKCDTTPQKVLVKDLDGLSSTAEANLKAWAWLLRSAAKAERIKSKARYAALP